MESSLQNFKAGIDGLISYIELEEAKEEFFKDGIARYFSSNESDVEFRFFVSSVVFRGSTNSKRFLYNSMIVSLYGYLESYIEGLIEGYISQLTLDCGKYSYVPAEVRNLHLELSIDLLKSTKKDRNLAEEDKLNSLKLIVKNMNSCINEVDDFSLNDGAYSIHTANFRYDSIHTIFQRVGINSILKLSLERDELKSEIKRINSLPDEVDRSILIKFLASELDDLAQRRNEIAHGSLNTDLQSLDLFKNRANFIKIIGCAIYDVVKKNSDEILFPLMKKFSLGFPSGIFQNISVIGYNFIPELGPPEDIKISIGDDIYSFNEISNLKLISGKIVALECNGISVSEVIFDKISTITIKVNFKLTSHMKKREIFVRR